jgi:aerobic-type carbon monoxide dehydrogenase small subunit (CoxS/CutS family)
MLAVQAQGTEVMTVEGLAREGGLNDLQGAFWERHALQCGFCTSGLLMSATELLDEDTQPTDEEILDVVSGHVCRCTGYEGIVSAIRDAARGKGGSGDG